MPRYPPTILIFLSLQPLHQLIAAAQPQTVSDTTRESDIVGRLRDVQSALETMADPLVLLREGRYNRIHCDRMFRALDGLDDALRRLKTALGSDAAQVGENFAALNATISDARWDTRADRACLSPSSQRNPLDPEGAEVLYTKHLRITEAAASLLERIGAPRVTSHENSLRSEMASFQSQLSEDSLKRLQRRLASLQDALRSKNIPELQQQLDKIYRETRGLDLQTRSAAQAVVEKGHAYTYLLATARGQSLPLPAPPPPAPAAKPENPVPKELLAREAALVALAELWPTQAWAQERLRSLRAPSLPSADMRGREFRNAKGRIMTLEQIADAYFKQSCTEFPLREAQQISDDFSSSIIIGRGHTESSPGTLTELIRRAKLLDAEGLRWGEDTGKSAYLHGVGTVIGTYTRWGDLDHFAQALYYANMRSNSRIGGIIAESWAHALNLGWTGGKVLGLIPGSVPDWEQYSAAVRGVAYSRNLRQRMASSKKSACQAILDQLKFCHKDTGPGGPTG